jgi:hypothetical protein
MDFKALLIAALKNPAIRAIAAPLLQAAAVVALEELTKQVKNDPTLIGKLLDKLADLLPK